MSMRERVRIVLGEFFVRIGFRLMGFGDIVTSPSSVVEDSDEGSYSGPVVTLSPKAQVMRQEVSQQPRPESTAVDAPLRGSLQDRFERARKGA